MSFLKGFFCAGVLGGIWAATPSLATTAQNGDSTAGVDSPSPTLPSGSDEGWKRMLSWSAPDPEASFKTTEHLSGAGMAPLRHLHISSAFGWRNDPFKGTYRRHEGIDLPGFYRARVMATAPGVVTVAGWVHGYGNLVEIEHAHGFRTRYGHLAGVHVARGEYVRQGELIGDMGSTGRSTGTHLHYEVRVNGNAVDPLQFIGRPGQTFETVWGAEFRSKPRWTGWAATGASEDTLPEAQIH